MLELDQPVDFTASSVEDLFNNKEYRNGIWALVEVDLSEMDPTPERVNVSLPRYVLKRIDTYSKARHETRSGFLARAAMLAMNES